MGLLVLSRKRHEDVIIRVDGVQIVVKTVAIIGDKVRLGFDAPRRVEIHRREVQRQIDQERQDSPAA